MKLTKEKLEQILEAVWDWTDYDIETCGYQDYDITPSMTNKDRQKVRQELEQILAWAEHPRQRQSDLLYYTPYIIILQNSQNALTSDYAHGVVLPWRAKCINRSDATDVEKCLDRTMESKNTVTLVAQLWLNYEKMSGKKMNVKTKMLEIPHI